MHLGNKRQAGTSSTVLPSRIDFTTAIPPGDPGGPSVYTTIITSFILSTQFNTVDGRPQAIWTESTSTTTATVSGPIPIISATPPPTIFPSTTTNSSPASVQSTPPSQSSSASSRGTPLSTLIPAIVVPIVVVALVAPIVLYLCLTRHDRQRSKSRMSSRVSSRAFPDPRAELKSPPFRHPSTETGASKASEIMNFDLGPTVEKPLPVVNVSRAPDDAYERPDTFQVHRGMEPPIGQAVSRYSGSHYSSSPVVDAPWNRTSIQELSEENMRIARLANDSKASFRGREQDEISDISAPEERTSRHVGRRGVDDLSDVSSIYEEA